MRDHGVKGWRRGSQLVGKPDFIFATAKLAVFVDGCFWHGHPNLGRLPAANRSYWSKKIARNKARDKRVNRSLRNQGWRVIRIWESDLDKNSSCCIRRIKHALKKRS
jgi:DNA mismatch endonuclease (patch repair protein)